MRTQKPIVIKPTTFKYSTSNKRRTQTSYHPSVTESTSRKILFDYEKQSTTQRSVFRPVTQKKRKQPALVHQREVTNRPINNGTTFVQVYADTNEANNDDSLEKSASAPKTVSNKYGNSNPYNEYSFNTYHTDDTTYKSSSPKYDDRYLFTSDMTAPKFGSHESNFGYFKPLNTQYKSKEQQHNQKFIPVHTDFLTDLSVSDLPLQSFPGKLKNYHPVQSHSSYDDKEVPHTVFHAPHSHTSVASREQIELYNEDVKDHYDDVIEHQLRTSTNLADRAKYHQFLKAKQDERVEQQSKREQSYHRNRPQHHHYNYPVNHRKPIYKKPISTPGLGHFRTPITNRSYNFPFI